MSTLHDTGCESALAPLALPWHSPGTPLALPRHSPGSYPIKAAERQASGAVVDAVGKWPLAKCFRRKHGYRFSKDRRAEAEAGGHSPGTALTEQIMPTKKQRCQIDTWHLSKT